MKIMLEAILMLKCFYVQEKNSKGAQHKVMLTSK